MKLVVVDTGLGNVRSVMRALEEASKRADVKADLAVSSDGEIVRRADAIVVPGQGAFRDCARALDAGLGEVLRESIARGTPYLGICLGLQILFASSDEAPGCDGLKIFAGHVVRLTASADVKVPHVGWNVVKPTRPTYLLSKPESFYFVHSYVVAPDEPDTLACASTDHGAAFVSAIERNNVTAVQFHPEKSQRAGLALLERFLRRC